MSKTALSLPPPPLKRRRLQPFVAKSIERQQQSQQPAGRPETAVDGSLDDFAAEEDAPEALPNDTLVALQLVKSRFPAEAGVAPFATRGQLYGVLADRTTADRQLEELRRCNSIRLLQLPASRDECVVMLATDYAAAIQRCKAQLQQQQQELPNRSQGHTAGAVNADLAVFDWFVERVLPACSEVMITHGELLELLAAAPPGRDARRQRLPSQLAAASAPLQATAAAAMTDKHVSLLLSQGLLTRHTAALDGYLFSMPNAGAAVRSVAAGRQEILSLMQRRRQPEIFEADLLKRKLQRSVLGVRWHLADMVGSGALLRIDTAVGPLLRAAKRGG